MELLYFIIFSVFVLAFGQSIFWAFKKAWRLVQNRKKQKLAQKQQMLLKADLRSSVRDLWISYNGDSDLVLTQIPEENKKLARQLLEDLENE